MLAESTIRRKIHKAIKETARLDRATRKFRVKSKSWGVNYNLKKKRWVRVDSCQCPMGCVLLYYQPQPRNPTTAFQYEPAAQALGVDEQFVRDFLCRFDYPNEALIDVYGRKIDVESLGHKIGKSFNRQYIK